MLTRYYRCFSSSNKFTSTHGPWFNTAVCDVINESSQNIKIVFEDKLTITQKYRVTTCGPLKRR